MSTTVVGDGVTSMVRVTPARGDVTAALLSGGWVLVVPAAPAPTPRPAPATARDPSGITCSVCRDAAHPEEGCYFCGMNW